MEHFDTFNNQAPVRGDLLISEPYLPDPNFERSVILLCEHNEEGSFGFVLNQQSKLSLAEVIEDAPDTDLPLFIGGPVQQDTLHFIHRSDHLKGESRQIGNGIYWGGDFEKLIFLFETHQITADEVRIFIGYSGWSPGQLMDELEAKSWIVKKQAETTHIFDYSHSELWRELLKNMGGKFKMFSNFPTDPRLN